MRKQQGEEAEKSKGGEHWPVELLMVYSSTQMTPSVASIARSAQLATDYRERLVRKSHKPAGNNTLTDQCALATHANTNSSNLRPQKLRSALAMGMGGLLWTVGNSVYLPLKF